jgi:hypothetical protein
LLLLLLLTCWRLALCCSSEDAGHWARLLFLPWQGWVKLKGAERHAKRLETTIFFEMRSSTSLRCLQKTEVAWQQQHGCTLLLQHHTGIADTLSHEEQRLVAATAVPSAGAMHMQQQQTMAPE